MSRLNWTKFNGAEFESLVHAILFFTVKDVVLFGRPGADRGQDAITEDHSHVYQAKYGKTLSMADAIGRTKTELDKIQETGYAVDATYTTSCAPPPMMEDLGLGSVAIARPASL